MRTAELKQRLGITSKNRHRWYALLLESGCLQTSRDPVSNNRTIGWNDRDVDWLLRLYEQNPKKTGYYPTHLITKYYQYYALPRRASRCLERYRKPGRVLDDQWRDQIQETARRLRTYQIMLTTLLKDAMKAGYPPLDSWTDTSLYDKKEREQIIIETRRREPGA